MDTLTWPHQALQAAAAAPAVLQRCGDWLLLGFVGAQPPAAVTELGGPRS
jgi:hypothetical protein